MSNENRLRILEARVAQLEERVRDLEKRQEPYPKDLTKISLFDNLSQPPSDPFPV